MLELYSQEKCFIHADCHHMSVFIKDGRAMVRRYSNYIIYGFLLSGKISEELTGCLSTFTNKQISNHNSFFFLKNFTYPG